MSFMFETEIVTRLGCDVEVKEINGRKYLGLRLPVGVLEKNDEGKFYDRTYWVDALYGYSEKLAPYLTKASMIYCRGALGFRVGTGQYEGSVFLSMMIDKLVLLKSTKGE